MPPHASGPPPSGTRTKAVAIHVPTETSAPVTISRRRPNLSPSAPMGELPSASAR